MAPVPLPPGYHSVNPYVVVAGADRFIGFLAEVFGGSEQGERELRPDGGIDHANILIGDSLVMVSEASATYPARPCVNPGPADSAQLGRVGPWGSRRRLAQAYAVR
ncbi:MAG: hypothetical protein M3519_02440 [Actinomycetota bacterium]|nr:hypothetical protein [Actinomycetota bacterium]